MSESLKNKILLLLQTKNTISCLWIIKRKDKGVESLIEFKNVQVFKLIIGFLIYLIILATLPQDDSHFNDQIDYLFFFVFHLNASGSSPPYFYLCF